MEAPAPAQDQVYLSGWPKRLVTSRLLPRLLLRAIARGVAGVMRRRIRARDRLDAQQVPAAGHSGDALYFADIYHGGETFWDWVVLHGGGLWWDVLWPLVITTSVERLQEHPELRTVLELDAHSYDELEQRQHPDIAALRAVIAAGRMEIANGTYAQPLAQTISGEANIRHFFYGLAAVERVLGATVQSFVAGEPQFFPQLPQILAGFGIEHVVFRTHWAPFGTDPAADADVVCWQGPDGSQVRTVPRYGCMDYRLMMEGHPGVQNAGLTGDDFEQWPVARKQRFAAAAARLGIRRPFITRLADPKPPESPFPKVFTAARNSDSRMVTIKEYFDAPHDHAPLVSYTIDDIPGTIPWGLAGEQLHREQVQAESALLVAERLDAVVQTLGATGQQGRLDAAWKLLLRAQHHDLLLCGPWHSTQHKTSMGEAGCRFARESSELAQAVTVTALEALAEQCRPSAVRGRAFLLFNPSPWPRREFVQLPADEEGVEVWQRGNRLTTQTSTIEDGTTVSFVVDLPPLGVDVVELRTAAPAATAGNPPDDVASSTDLIASEFGTDAISGGYLTVWKDGRLHRSTVEGIACTEDGPVFRRYRLDGRLAGLAFVQWITVISSLQRIQLSTDIDFGSGQHLGPQMADHRSDLAYYIQDEKKLCLNFESRLPHAFCDSPFLLVEPKDSRITGLSFIGLDGNGSGIAMLHRGTPGWHVDRDAGIVRNVLAWGPERWLYASDDSITPGWSRHTALCGTHRFEHAIALVATRLDALRAASDFRLPVLAVDIRSGEGSSSVPWGFVEPSPTPVVLTALFAHNGNIYARLWNAGGEPLDANLNGTAVSFRLQEEKASGWPRMRPWGIQTVRLQRGSQ